MAGSAAEHEQRRRAAHVQRVGPKDLARRVPRVPTSLGPGDLSWSRRERFALNYRGFVVQFRSPPLAGLTRPRSRRVALPPALASSRERPSGKSRKLPPCSELLAVWPESSDHGQGGGCPYFAPPGGFWRGVAFGEGGGPVKRSAGAFTPCAPELAGGPPARPRVAGDERRRLRGSSAQRGEHAPFRGAPPKIDRPPSTCAAELTARGGRVRFAGS